MRYFLLFIIILCFYQKVSSQNITLDIVTSAGDLSITKSAMIDWTIGEPIIETAINNSYIASQGFQQSDLLENTNDEITQNDILQINPNPTKGLVNLNYNADYLNNNYIQAEVTDMYGKRIYSYVISPNENIFQLDLTQYAKGLFILKCYIININGNNEVKKFKIIKI